MKKTGRNTTPVIMIDDEIIVGFNRSRVEQLLEL